MPRFSIIVPAHGVEGRLSLALDSVLTRSFGDFELIPVHDAPDAPAATVTAAYAERDTRLSPVGSPPSAGLSGARNAGTAAATGAYLLFLDGDDTLAPGALAALHARLLSSGDPDVLLYFDHERVHWKVTLLYAPTHRDHATGFDARLDLEAFREAIGDPYAVLLRAHYFRDRGGPARSGGRIIDVTHHRSSEDVCLAADALVTDYSSIMSDYAGLDRPIVVYADGWEVYRETRGVCFGLLEAPPGPVARTPEELVRCIRDGSYADTEAAALRAVFRERFCPYDDGRAAERVVRTLLLGEPEVPAPRAVLAADLLASS